MPLSLAAQQPWDGSAGPYAPVGLLLPAGARTLALGNTGIASRDDDVLFFNPAQIAIARGFSASGERYSPNSGGGALSAVTRFNTGGIALGMRMADYELPLGVFPANRGTMLGSGLSQGTTLEATVGVAQVIKGLRVGGAAKYVEDNASLSRVGRAAFDLGVSKDLFRFYTFGLAVQNIGTSMKVPASCEALSITCTAPPPVPGGGSIPQLTTVNLPLRTTLGVATSRAVGEFDVVATAAVSMVRADWFSASGGAEIGYSWLDGYAIALRAGARRPLPGERPFTAGAGFTMDRLSIDYALELLTAWRLNSSGLPESAGRVGQRIGLRIR
jgi:hypothetical protein